MANKKSAEQIIARAQSLTTQAGLPISAEEPSGSGDRAIEGFKANSGVGDYDAFVELYSQSPAAAADALLLSLLSMGDEGSVNLDERTLGELNGILGTLLTWQ